jgi:hypothetical protein
MKTSKSWLSIAALVIVIILAGDITVSSDLNRGLLSTDKDSYELGEKVTIAVRTQNLRETSLKVTTPEKVYTYINPPEQAFYIPRVDGVHQLEFYSYTSLLDSVSFTVGKGIIIFDPYNGTPQAPHEKLVSVEKKEYFLGERVLIALAGNMNYSLEIIAPSHKYKYLGIQASPVIFTPPTAGRYELVLSDNYGALDTESFLVKNMENQQEDIISAVGDTGQSQQAPDTAKIDIRLHVKDSSGRLQNAEIDLIKEHPTGRRKFRFTAFGIMSTEEKKLDLEIRLPPINNIRFEGLDAKEELVLKFEDLNLTRLNGVKVEKAYAIDPSSLSFSSAEISATAKGRILMKCKDYDFDSQTCHGSWEKIMDLVPGEEYSIEIDAQDPAFAEVGLAAVNSEKPIYRPGEQVKLIMTVLDNEGYLVFGAEINMNITFPDGSVYSLSTKNGFISQLQRGIYEAILDGVYLEGEYGIHIHASAEDVDSNMYSYFLVSEDYDYDIIRQTPIVTDPFKGPFHSAITVISYSAEIFNLTEALPADFRIIDDGGARVTYQGELTYLTWNNLRTGSTVSYIAHPPEVSPELYELRSFVSAGDRFDEARPWFIAIDPPYPGEFYLFWDSAANEPPGWTCVSCNSSGEFYNRLVKGYDVFGGTGGAYTHTHTLGYVSSTGGGGGTGQSDASVLGATAAHTHSALNGESVSEVSNLPIYRQLKVIRYDGTNIPETIPQGAIAVFNTSSLPTGWTRYSVQDGYFLFANNTANFTGGSNTHTHTVVAGLGASSGTASTRTGGGQTTVAGAGHTHAAGTGTSSSVDHRPLFLNVVLAKANTDTPLPYAQGFIAMFSDDLPEGWSNLSQPGQSFYDRHLVGAATYGGTGGSASHSHTNLAVTVGTPSATVSTRSGGSTFSSATHTHSVTVSFSTADHRPPYINVIFGYARELIEELDYAPTVTLNSPLNGTTSLSTNVQFSCTVTDDYDIFNVTLYTNHTGTFSPRQTINVEGSSNTSYTALFNIALPDQSSLIWNCLAYDNSSQSGWASSNFTLYVNERAEPLVTLISPANSSVMTQGSVDFQCSADDDQDIQSLALFTNRTGVFAFEQVQVYPGINDKSVSHTFTQSGFLDGQSYSWNCKAIDNSSIEMFAESNYHFSVYLGIPNITLVSPSENAYSLNGSVQLTCAGYDNHDVASISLYHNLSGTFQLNQTASFPGISDTSATVTFNLTAIPYGTRFKWTCLVTDNSSNQAFATENRSVTVARLEHFYGYASYGGWYQAFNAIGKPDGTVASQRLNDEAILSISNFSGMPNLGTILSKYLTVAWYADSLGDNDQLDLGYSVSAYDTGNFNLDGTAYTGSTFASNFPLVFPQNQSYAITGTITTANLANLRLRLQGDQITNPDNNFAHIDSLYYSMQFDYYPTSYNATKSKVSVYTNDLVDFYTNWRDDFYLSCYIFSHNQTGTWQNSSCISFPFGKL